MRLLVKGARIVSPVEELDGVMDLLVENGRIAALGFGLPADGAQEIDGTGLTLLPGLVDLHAHFGEPGHEDRETMESGAAAAARGGYTTVLLMPDTDPPLDNPAAVAQAVARGKQTDVHVLVAGALTKQLAGAEMSELQSLVNAGAVALAQPDGAVPSAGLLRRILQYAGGLAPLLMEQPVDVSLVADGMMHEGTMSTIYGIKGVPASAEEVAVARDILLAAETGSALHLSGISTAGAVRQITAAKENGVKVTCDVSPYHLVLTDEALASYDPNCKLMPPLRAASDVAALQDALASGVIDCVATNHTPLIPEEKDVEFGIAPYGAVALEITLPLLYTHLVRTERLTLTQLLQALSCRPAALLGRMEAAGTLTPGSSADFVLVDLERAQEVIPARMLSQGRNTPVGGHSLFGWPVATYVGGKAVWQSTQR